MTASESPPNIQDFNEITGVLFGRLYVSFPTPTVIAPEVIAAALGLESTESQMSSGKPFKVVFVHTIDWLKREQFIRDAVPPMDKVVLTTKGLGALNIVPASLGRRLGSELVDATKRASTAEGKREIAGIMGEFIGSLTGSFTKSVSGGH